MSKKQISLEELEATLDPIDVETPSEKAPRKSEIRRSRTKESIKLKNFHLPNSLISRMEDVAYNESKRLGRRVTNTEIVTAALNEYLNKFPEIAG